MLEEIEREGADPFAALEKETPSESLPKKEPKEGEPKEGDNTPVEPIPFHQDARWIKREEELKELRERDELRGKELQDLKAFREEAEKRFTPNKTLIPDWFKELYGENDVAWQKYSEREVQREQEITQRILGEQQKAQKQQAEEVSRWNHWVDDEVGKLQKEGQTFDRNRLIKTMLDYRPTDEDGNLDFKAGMKIYQALEEKETPSLDARKELADATMQTGSKGEKPKKDYMTSAELRSKSWQTIA